MSEWKQIRDWVAGRYDGVVRQVVQTPNGASFVKIALVDPHGLLHPGDD